MSNGFVIQSTVEIILSVLFIWGLFHEEKLAKLERKIFSRLITGIKSRCGYSRTAAKQADR